MRYFKATLAYDGSDFAGWQVQNELRTVQAAFERALESVTGEFQRVMASGRTDAGVHALGQVVSFRSTTRLSGEVLHRALNANVPEDMQILSVEQAPDNFHAIRDATGKRYRYVVQDGPVRDLFLRRYCWWIRQRLDEHAMREAASHLVGRHDFSSFEKSGAERTSSVRTVRELTIERLGDCDDRMAIEIEADGFLYNMVRNIVGSLVEVGRGAKEPYWIPKVLAACDRRLAGPTAPPQGLFLVKVDY